MSDKNKPMETAIKILKEIFKLDEPLIITGMELVCIFNNYEEWLYDKEEIYDKMGMGVNYSICVDAKGRICFYWDDFNLAKIEDCYPIKLYVRSDAKY